MTARQKLKECRKYHPQRKDRGGRPEFPEWLEPIVAQAEFFKNGVGNHDSRAILRMADQIRALNLWVGDLIIEKNRWRALAMNKGHADDAVFTERPTEATAKKEQS